MYKKKNIMDSISIESFADIIKTNPSTVIDNAFKDAEKSKSGGEKTGLLSAIKNNSIVLKLSLKRFKELYHGNHGMTAAKYIEELDVTQGVYGKRDTEVRVAVRSMYELINGKIGKGITPNGVIRLYIRLYDQVVSNSKWSDAFNIAYKLHARGIESATAIYMNYIFTVFALEYLTLVLRNYVEDISQGKWSEINTSISVNYKSFVYSVAHNVIPILVSCENTKDPKKYVNEVFKIEKETSTESEDPTAPMGTELVDDIDSLDSPEPTVSSITTIGDTEIVKEIPEIEEVSTEDAIASALIYGALSVIIAITVIHGIRYIIYAMQCLVVDITKSLKDQSYTLLVSIESLERKLATLKPESKEYKDLEIVIEKQKALTQKLMDVTNKLAGTDMESIDDIRKKDHDDTVIIDDSEGDSDSSGSLDI